MNSASETPDTIQMANRQRLGHSQDRRASIVESRLNGPSGGFTTHAAAKMAEGIGGVLTTCTITGHHQTFIFELPGCYLVAEGTVGAHVIYSADGFTAAVVSDLLAYFEHGGTTSTHYALDVSLREEVARVYEQERLQQSDPQVPIFLVVEQQEQVPTTTLDKECFVVDGSHLQGGKKGDQALLAIRTVDGSWPDFSPDTHAVNLVLAAVKVEQNLTCYIIEHCAKSCFVTDEGRAVATIAPRMDIVYGGLRVESRLEEKDLEIKVDRIRLALEGIQRDATAKPQIAELMEAVLLDRSKDDKYFRLWYLRLWQALMDARKLIRVSKFTPGEIVAGKKTINELHDYRDRIAHWWTGRLDASHADDIQRTVVKLLRSRYGLGD